MRSEPEEMEEMAKLVVVAEVPVALTKVKFCKVLEALSKRFARVPRPVEVKLPPFPVVKNKLVELAVVEKRLVVVAEVPVALTKVKFWSVDEPLTYRLVVVALVVIRLAKVCTAVHVLGLPRFSPMVRAVEPS